MSRKRYTLRKEEIAELQVAYDQSRNGQTKIRYQAVRLYGAGKAVEDIMEITGCSRASLMEWNRTYRQEGIAGLVDKRQGGNSAKLTAAQIEHLQSQLHGYEPAQLLGADNCVGNGQFWTVPDLAQHVEKNYGVTYKSKNSYRSLLRKCGLSLQRPAGQYKSRNEIKVLHFEQELEKN